MGRLDSWLNRQIGWRRVAVVWVTVCPLAVGLGNILWRGIAFPEMAALSVLVAMPFAGLAAVAQLRWQARHPRMPFLSWRMTVSIWCLTASLLIDTLMTRHPYPHRLDSAVFLAGLALIAASFVFLVLATHQQSKVRNSGWRWSGRSPD